MFGPNSGISMEYILTAIISGNNADIQLHVSPDTKVASFSGIVLVFNAPQVAVAVSAGFITGFINAAFTSRTFNLSASIPTFGPNFDGKCILGMQSQKLKGLDSIHFYFTNTSTNNY